MPGMRAFTPPELQRVLSALEDRPRDWTLVVLGCHTAFRISELLALTVAHVADGSQIRNEINLERRNMKGGRGSRARSVTSRRVVLNKTARSALLDYLSRRFDGPVWPPQAPLFPSRKGSGAIGREHAWKIIHDSATSAGVSGKIGAHSLRKTAASRIFTLSGNNLLITQKVLGHRHVTTTAAYLDTSRESVDEAVMALDRIDADPQCCAQPSRDVSFES